jgi:cyclohexanone monooxygenase
MEGPDNLDYEVIVVGAGFAGLMALHTLRSEGLRVLVIETAAGVGGTWYWNRYPGARVDVESMEYCYSFPEELQQEWEWTEKYSSQREVLRYLEWVADHLDLRRDIRLETRLERAAFDENTGVWNLWMSGAVKTQLRARYFVLATGFLSAPMLPDIPGLSDFQGEIFHTARWPKENVDLSGRVGVIGTGASGVQVVQTLAGHCRHLLVFQRTPCWAFPLRNTLISAEYREWVKAHYKEIRRLELECRGPGFVLMGGKIELPEPRRALEASPEERRADYERRWSLGGLHIARSFIDLNRDRAANDTLRAFLEEKIRAAVRDPAVAEKLIPEFPPLSRRPPGEQGYYDAFNRNDVSLVDVKADPIARITKDGITLESGATYQLDTLICATGFDGGSGAALRIDIVGRDGVSLVRHWSERVRTYLGMMVVGFPNMFMINGPQSPCVHFVPPLLAEYQTNYIWRIIKELEETGQAIEPLAAIEAAWSDHVNELYAATLIPHTNSWWIGTNVKGKPRQALAYAGGFAEYRRRCERAAERGFQDYVRSPRRSSKFSKDAVV